MTFESFDPLKYKSSAETEVAAIALKREIKEILNSYVGWYDPFAELIQNSLDSLEERMRLNEPRYEARLNIIINIQQQTLTVTDNGMGLGLDQFNQFLVPFFSFKTKNGKTRGHKGVGATYLGYGFNYIQVCTKAPDFEAVGKMVNSRNWLNDENPAGRPQVTHDQSGPVDKSYLTNDRGVSITLKFDSTTHPRDLKWIGTSSAESWLDILRVKTGLGAFTENDDIKITLNVTSPTGKVDQCEREGTGYMWIQDLPNVNRSMGIKDLESRLTALYNKKGIGASLTSALKNFDCIYDKFETLELDTLVKLDKEEKWICETYSPRIYCAYTYSAKVFTDYNDSLNVRDNYRVLTGGFQISANNMPQGEILQVPLQRYIGRQNQVHFLIDFNNISADLGRKGFHKDIVDFCKTITEKITTNYLTKFKASMRPNTGVPNDIKRKQAVNDWKDLMKDHEIKHPLVITNEHFFLPTKKISLTSEPTREQDVIALFNQLLAGGVIRGVSIMSTNERFTYDGLYHIRLEEPTKYHIYDATTNPLGVLRSVIDDHDLPFVSSPEILEYKYSLDGLIEDISDGTKNSNEVGLVVVWRTGTSYKDNYHITSLLDDDNLSERQYHGVTHKMTNVQSGQQEMDLIVLSELIQYLNDQDETVKKQKEKYDE